MQPIQILPTVLAETPFDLVQAVLSASDQQVHDKQLADADARAEFAMAADALNLHRVVWRCTEEWGQDGVGAVFVRQLKADLCRRRRYDPDDFESALLATRARARLPFGWTAVDLALWRAGRGPIRLLHPDLATSRLATQIANIARNLQLIQEGEPILLPIEQLRAVLGQRKVVVSGAVMRLLEAGVLTCVDSKYHTGKAREYRFTGKEHEHYEEVQPAVPLDA
jgi:hypothetical protein